MLYTSLTKKAMQIAFDAHVNQKDKSGLPYIFHPYQVAQQMTDEISTCVALLHDVVEDTDISIDDLAAQGMPQAVIDALLLLSHDSDTPYMDYIGGIKASGNKTAIAVKLADLRHNSDVSRLDFVDERMAARLEKYRSAMELLQE